MTLTYLEKDILIVVSFSFQTKYLHEYLEFQTKHFQGEPFKKVFRKSNDTISVHFQSLYSTNSL